MDKGTLAGNDAFEVASAVGGEVVGGLVGFAFSAVARDDKTRVSDGADERDAFTDKLFAAFVGMEGEVKFIAKVRFDDADVADELVFLLEGDDDVEIVDVATVMLITEFVSNKAVELIEENIRNKLTSEIADDNTAARLAIEEAFVRREGGPVSLRTADDNTAHRVVVDDLVPNELGEVVEALAIERMAENAVFLKVTRRELVERSIEAKLMVEAPSNAFI